MGARPGALAMLRLVVDKKIIVCCGAGGVGKTTTAAALALAGARAGRRVLVLTIDPSKRLAQTLGVERNPPEPVPLDEERLHKAGVEPPGSLAAWMLDPKLVSDSVVRRLTRNEEEARRVMENRVYQHVTQMIAGMQEYTAMEALRALVTSGRYDLVVLDTPPSRNALHFLEAPDRLLKFLDGRILGLFLPREDAGFIRRTTTKIITAVLAGVFGEEFAEELTRFFGTFHGIFGILGGNAREMRTFLSTSDVAFLLVTSPAQEALAEARFFRERIRELRLPFRGFILNRSQACTDGFRTPESSELLPSSPSPEQRSAFDKLAALARAEREAAERDQELVLRLEDQAGEAASCLALPYLPSGVDDLPTLVTIADALSPARA